MSVVWDSGLKQGIENSQNAIKSNSSCLSDKNLTVSFLVSISRIEQL
jgi:hypothetical protein